MNSRLQIGTNFLVIVFLVVNGVYLFKLTEELRTLNGKIESVKESIDGVRAVVRDLGARAKGLDGQAGDLAKVAQEKIRELKLDDLLKPKKPKKSAPVQSAPAPDPWRKVELDLQQLDKDGLRGPPDGKVAVSYEFCIPNTPECTEEVKGIDASVEFSPGSRGRIGAGTNECLCVGSTHQPNHREVLGRLAALPYVKRIIECHFE